MFKKLSLVLIATSFFAVACGGEDTSSNNNNNNQSMMTQETCRSSHDCINGICECKTPGKDGNSCSDNDACKKECEVCS